MIMNRNIIVVVLVVLLIATIGGGIYLFSKNTQLQNENKALQQKITKGLAYSQALNLLFEPGRVQAGLSQTEPLDWMNDFTKAIKSTGDSKLEDFLSKITKGGTEGETVSLQFMYYAASQIVNSLK